MIKIKNYNQFINENINQAKSIMQKKLDDYEKLKTLLSKNFGYIGKFTEYLMHENVPYEELEKLYKELIELKTKQISIDINPLKYEKVIDKIIESKETLSINSLVSKFPSEQKKFARELLDKEDNYSFETNKNIFLKVSQKVNLEAFVNKVSRYKTKDELITSLKIFSKDPINEKEKVIELLKTLKSKVVYNENDLLIVMVDGFEDIVKLGSDTSWCIVRSKSTYNTYAKNRYQFILYNYKLDEYDPKFKIGFTVNRNSTIHTAHDVLDSGCISEINAILKEHNISLKDIIPKLEPIMFDINKLNSKINRDTLSRIVEECDLKILPEVIKKVLIMKKSNLSSLAKIAFNRLYVGREYVLQSELNKISPEFYSNIEHNTHNVVGDYKVDLRLDEPAFIKGLEIWPDKSYANDESVNMYKFDDIEDRYSNETILKLADKLNDIYANDKISFKNFYKNDSCKGVKLSQKYEAVMMAANALVGKLKNIPDYDILIKTPNSELRNYCGSHTHSYTNLVNLPIDLDQDKQFTIEDIEFGTIIKKDYIKGIYIKADYPKSLYLDKYTKLSEYLKDFKLTLCISKNDLRSIVRNPNFDSDHKNGRIINILNKFKISRLVYGTTISDGNLSIRVY